MSTSAYKVVLCDESRDITVDQGVYSKFNQEI